MKGIQISTLLELITAHTAICSQSSNFLVFSLQPVYIYFYLHIYKSKCCWYSFELPFWYLFELPLQVEAIHLSTNNICFYKESKNKSHKHHLMVVYLSLLTMTNPDQMCDVLLFVCSKVADETNLSSKLPVADRIREV